MASNTGEPEVPVGKAFGRMFTVRRSLLPMIEQSLHREAQEDEANRIPAFAYDSMSQERVKVQLMVYPKEGA